MRSIASGVKFYQLPPDKDNTDYIVIIICNCKTV